MIQPTFFQSTQFYIYIALWIAYLMQNALGFGASAVGQVILAFLLCWSMLNLYKVYTNSDTKPKALNVTLVLLASFVLYGVYSMLFDDIKIMERTGAEVPLLNYAKNALISILPIFSFYYLSSKNLINDKQLKLLAFVFIAIMIFSFYYNESRLLQIALLEGRDITEVTNNAGFLFIYIIPFIYLFKNQKISLALLIIVMTFLLLGMKRGAILTGSVGAILYLRDMVKDGSIGQKVGKYMVVIIFLIVVSYMVVDYYNESPYFRYRIEQTLEGKSSGRDTILEDLWEYFINKADVLQWFFGSGANATLDHADNYAHNDWMEMLIDQGLVGVALMVAFFVYLYKDIAKLKFYNSRYFQSARSLYFMILLKTFFSMSICAMLPYATLPIGYFLYKLHAYETGQEV